MILPPFELHRPETLQEALEVGAALGPDCRWLAGGTQLLVALKYGEAEAAHLVDLKRLGELQTIAPSADGGMRVGAGVPYHAMRRHPGLRRSCPAFVDLVSRIGNPRVRAAGTLGGNLGFADPRWDPITLLVAMGGDVGLASAEGERRVPVAEFVRGPSLTALREGELITDVGVPGQARGAYLKFQVAGRATLGLAVAGSVQDGAFREPPRVVVGAAVPRPTMCREAAALLAGRPLVARDPGVRRAAEAAAEEVQPFSDPFASASYKRRLVRALLPRAVERMAVAEAA